MVCLRNICINTLHKGDNDDDDDDNDDDDNNNNTVQFSGTDRHDEFNSHFSQFCEHA